MAKSIFEQLRTQLPKGLAPEDFMGLRDFVWVKTGDFS